MLIVIARDGRIFRAVILDSFRVYVVEEGR